MLKGESEKDKEEREENELIERAAYDEKAKRILENRKVKESLNVGARRACEA